MVELIGTNERDTLRGTDEADLIYGEGQSDFLEGKGGADIIYGGNGEDWIVGDFGGTYDGGDGFDTLELNARNATTGIFFSNEKPRTYFAGIEALTGVLSNFDDKVVITLATNVRDIPLDASRGVDELVLDYSASSKNVTADWETGQTEAINTITIGGGSFSYRFLDFETITLKLGASDDYMGLYCTSLTVFGNGGNDELSGYYADESQLFGGNGNDSLNGHTSALVLKGGGGNDQIFATPDDLTAIYGGSGIDHLIMDGRNLVSGLEIGTGASSTFSDIELVSGSLTGFDDTVKISVGQNTVDLYSGYSVDAKAGEDHLILRLAGAEDEFDSISMDGDHVVFLDGRNQSLLGYIGFETFDIVGSDLNETLRGGRLADIINGGHGDDVLFGVNGNDTLLGGGGNDLLEGAANGGAVLMQGGDGNDRLELSGNLALLAYGGAGNDSLEGNLRHVKVWGDGGDDQITAAGELYGGKGDDRLLTFGDDSFLFGGLGNDRLDGGGSNNTFMFEGNSATGKDTIGAIDADDAIYIGGGVLFDDLVFTVQGFDLLVEWDMGSVLIYSGATMNITFFTDQPASNQAANQIVTQSTMDTLL